MLNIPAWLMEDDMLVTLVSNWKAVVNEREKAGYLPTEKELQDLGDLIVYGKDARGLEF